MDQFSHIGVRENKVYPSETHMTVERVSPKHPNKTGSSFDCISTLNFPAFYSTFSWVLGNSYLETSYVAPLEYVFTLEILDFPENKHFVKTTSLNFGARCENVVATFKNVVVKCENAGVKFKNVEATFENVEATFKNVVATHKNVVATHKNVVAACLCGIATFLHEMARCKNFIATFLHLAAKFLFLEQNACTLQRSSCTMEQSSRMLRQSSCFWSNILACRINVFAFFAKFCPPSFMKFKYLIYI
jgi:hypothetical protein